MCQISAPQTLKKEIHRHQARHYTKGVQCADWKYRKHKISILKRLESFAFAAKQKSNRHEIILQQRIIYTDGPRPIKQPPTR
jgi:hypothetical protein